MLMLMGESETGPVLERTEPADGLWVWLVCLRRSVFDLLLPQPHLLLCLLPAQGLLQTSLDQIIGEPGHGNLTGFGFVMEGADEKTR